VGDLPEVRPKAVTAAAPNLVHGLDGAHLQRVAIWAGDAKIPFVTVHDCFGCLAADAKKFRAMVHDQLAQMYRDRPRILYEIWEYARCELSPSRRAKLPDPPVPESLSPEDIRFIEDVRYAQYITS